MAGPGRKELLCEQAPAVLTGIDFIWVDPADHTRLSVFFVMEPDQLTRPVDTASSEFTATITGQEDGSVIEAASYAWDVVNDASGNPRLTLTVVTETEGDFQTYMMALTDRPNDAGASRLDRFCAAVPFSFKQPCPSPFDCKREKPCPEEELADYPVDYLARDFESFRQALLAFAAERYPDWEAAVPADFGGMMAELLAALGDEFSYIQDRFQREGYLATLTQRRSFNQIARLVDYRLDPGQAASGLIVVRLHEGRNHPPPIAPTIVALPPGIRVWADQDDRPPVPFEMGRDLAGMISGKPTFPVHSHWTDLPTYVPDPQQPCLPVGAREMFVNSRDLISGPFPPDVLAADIGAFWVGRQVLIETRPNEPNAPVRRVVVTIDEPVEAFDDPLTQATSVVRLHWRAEDALTFELDQTQAFVSANLVPVRAGMTVCEKFTIGPNDDGLPRTVERAGPARDGARPAIHRFTMGATVENGLGWQTETDPAGVVRFKPDAVLVQIDPDGGGEITTWTVSEDALNFKDTTEAVSAEPGRWAPVARFERWGQRILHEDYAGDQGYTLRFGDGVFGRQPTYGDIFYVFYRTGPGRAGNVPADTITRVDLSPEGECLNPAIPNLGTDAILTAQNPFPLTDGRDPQSLDLARRIAPAAYKALTFRAVRDEDYREQAERLDWVQEAGAITRWTGAWASTFVSADPKGAFRISDERFGELQARLSAVRQAGRCVIARQPVFAPLDLKIAVCIEQGFAFGAVAERILAALSPARNGFFHPDRFSFGDPLRRPALEAAIACVEGVRAVMAIQIREQGRTGYHLFDVAELPVADNRILKVENDPNRPGQGSIRVYEKSIPAMETV